MNSAGLAPLSGQVRPKNVLVCVVTIIRHFRPLKPRPAIIPQMTHSIQAKKAFNAVHRAYLSTPRGRFALSLLRDNDPQSGYADRGAASPWPRKIPRLRLGPGLHHAAFRSPRGVAHTRSDEGAA